jgi:hypothetical protein
MKIAGSIVVVALLGGFFVWAEPGRAPRSPIAPEEVRQAIARAYQARGVDEEQWPRAEQIEVPVAVTALAERSLRVTVVCWDADRARLQFQLECRDRQQCMPFLAYARTAAAASSPFSPPAVAPCREGADATTAAPKRPAPRNTLRARPVVRAGEHATVVFVGTRLRLSAEVTCLERGADGDVIRVRNPDGRTFRARVLGPHLLEAMAQE